eukprot:NODE_2059_length_1148_cov_63.253673_g2042_i0.p1 GENE.NODE_2059_length_1148_cov_63.253673_g2042_i0~~NODE_2059_length_1148_cov_63.253673_g2042_i0.p1  ORF type:complete len:305 (-),score=39.48 NODE_2059_length_1148_cov_63.253673_g2042_i0:130-1044(-)
MNMKRIMQEAKDFAKKPCREFHAQPSDENSFEWLFTMRGPDDTEFSEGFYRGRVILPHNYPFSPPDVVLLTPNGRFELNKKICLSVSSYHPETWKPTWNIKTVLTALRLFMATPGNNGLGAMSMSAEKRKLLARESHDFVCPITKKPVREDIELMEASPASAPVEVPPTPETKPVDVDANVAPASQPPDTADVPPDSEPGDAPQHLAAGDQEPANAALPADPAPDAADPPNDDEQADGAAAENGGEADEQAEDNEPEHDGLLLIDQDAIDKWIALVLILIFAILFKKAFVSGLVHHYFPWFPHL